MSDEKKISPLPWELEESEGGFQINSSMHAVCVSTFCYAPEFKANGEFIVKACNSYHANQQALADKDKRISELEDFAKEITTYKTTDRIKEDINFMLDNGRSCPTFEQTLEAIYKSIKSKAKKLLGGE
jgi:hypothetical protein